MGGLRPVLLRLKCRRLKGCPVGVVTRFSGTSREEGGGGGEWKEEGECATEPVKGSLQTLPYKESKSMSHSSRETS